MAETLRKGSKGPLVQRWKQYLRGLDIFMGEVNDDFDEETKEATERFQALHRLHVDGIAGNQTLGRAMVDGFEVIPSSDAEKTGPNWPPPPTGPALNQATRQALFGGFGFRPAPTPFNPEGVQILGNWVRENIVSVEIPQLKGIKGAPANGRVSWHIRGVQQVTGLFKAWEEAGLLHLVLTWGGSWNPRFIRGSKTVLSNHAFGTAFDINAAWNGLGARPALVGQHGSVRELVPIAAEFGFYWGGWFGSGRSDGMHFEIAKILS